MNCTCINSVNAPCAFDIKYSDITGCMLIYDFGKIVYQQHIVKHTGAIKGAAKNYLITNNYTNIKFFNDRVVALV